MGNSWFLLCPFRTVEYISDHQKNLSLKRSKWHFITLTQCSFVSYTHTFTKRCSPLIFDFLERKQEKAHFFGSKTVDQRSGTNSKKPVFC